jgi:hypothetical protein
MKDSNPLPLGLVQVTRRVFGVDNDNFVGVAEKHHRAAVEAWRKIG